MGGGIMVMLFMYRYLYRGSGIHSHVKKIEVITQKILQMNSRGEQ